MVQEAEKNDGLPVEFHAASVESMFADARSFTIGALASCFVALFVAYQYDNAAILSIAVGLLLVAGLRLALVRLYLRRPKTAPNARDLHRWETYYVVGASAHVMLLGAFCLITFLETPEGFGRLASLAIVMAYLVGIPGRNFASNRLVNVLTVCAAVPMLSALFLSRGLNWVIALLVLLPFFAAMRSIAIRLRGIFVDATLRAKELSKLAGQFDSALNNMPCGLAMLDTKGRVVVTNNRLKELLRIDERPGREYPDVATVLAGCMRDGLIGAQQLLDVENGLKARMSGGNFEELLLEYNNGRVLSLTLQPMENGGAVVLFDDITERKVAQARINELARFDPLTGLPNRVEFREQATIALNSKADDADAAVLFVDLDQFKQVNDTLGHGVGDLLLCASAERLRRAAGPHQLVARLGGDEFVLLIGSVESLAEIEAIARTVIQELATPFEIAGNHLRLSASVGIARAVDVGCELGALLRCADMALYQAKADGRGAWRIFEPGMEIKARARRELEFDLRVALENEQLELYFQPIHNVAENEFLGCEALLRWRHPQRGFVSPGVFVPIAEEIGLVVKLDEWVLRRACRAATAWPSKIRVAVNLSAVHFQNTRIVETIKQALSDSGLPAHRLEVEITETALLQNLQMTRSVLQEVCRLGVRISLDDFGTGYSSLSYLHSLPLNKIKIDRSFLTGLELDPRALKLLHGVTRLSKDLGLVIVMEGVETKEQLDLVTGSTSVDEVQGFLFSRPIPQAEMTNLFAKSRRSAA